MAIPQKSHNYTTHPSKKIYDKEKIKGDKPKSIENTSFEVIEKNLGKEKFSLITFEGGKDFCKIPNISTNVTTIQFPNWISLIQKESGGSSNAENIPSSNTIASWIKCENEQDNIRNILFEYPVSSVSLYYSSYFPIKICAYDSNNKLIATIQGSKNWSNESGYSEFNELTIRQNKDTIKKLKIESFAEYIAIDNLKVSRISSIPDKNFIMKNTSQQNNTKNETESISQNPTEQFSSNDNVQKNTIPKEKTIFKENNNYNSNENNDNTNSNDTINNSNNSSSNNENNDSNKTQKNNQSKTFDKLFIALALYLLFFHNPNNNMSPMGGPMMPPNINPNMNPNNPNMPPNRY